MGKKFGFLIVIILFIGATPTVYYILRKQQQPNLETFAAIPMNASVIIEVKKTDLFLNQTQSKNLFLNQISLLKGLDKVFKGLQKIDSIADAQPSLKELINKQSLLLSIHKEGKDQYKLLSSLHTTSHFKLNQILKLLNAELEKTGSLKTTKYNQVKIQHFQGACGSFYFCAHRGFLMASNSEMLLQDAIRQAETDNGVYSMGGFQDLRKTAGNHVDANIYIHFKNSTDILTQFFAKEGLAQNGFLKIGDWVELDLNLKSETLLFNGFANKPAEASVFYNLLDGQEPQNILFINALPPTCESFSGFGISNLALYFQNLERYMEKNDQGERFKTNHQIVSGTFGDQYRKELQQVFRNEIGQAGLSGGETLFFIRTSGYQGSMELIQEWLKHATVQNQTSWNDLRTDYKVDNETIFPIFKMPVDYLPTRLFGPWFKSCRANYVTAYKDYIIFGDSYSSLCEAIYTNVLQKNLMYDKAFVQFSNFLASKSNYYGYLSLTGSGEKLQQTLSAKAYDYYYQNQPIIQPFYALAWQFSNENHRIYNNLLFTYLPTNTQKKKTVWETRLDTAIALKPELVINHQTREKEILVQDAKYQIYLINKSGRILWKKTLNEPILGEIKQVDYYKNGKLQYLFNTPSQIHLIDRNGNYVERYPVSLSAKAVNGLSVFDYGNNRSYRIFVPCNNQNVYGFDLEGNIVSGFKFSGTDEAITSPVQYFRDRQNDYLLVTDSSRIYILDRKGNTRLKLENQFSASPNNTFVYSPATNTQKSCLIRTNKKGTIHYVFFDGKTETKHLRDFSPQHYFAYEDVTGDQKPDYVFVDGPQLAVFSAEGIKEFEVAFPTNINVQPSFYKFSSNQTGIGITEPAQQKIHLINSNGAEFKGFPLYGISRFSIGILQPGSGEYQLIVGGDERYLYNYKLN